VASKKNQCIPSTSLKKDGPAQIGLLIIPVNFNNPSEAVTVKTFMVDVDVITFSVMNMNL
jgi:hypothetical protein